MLVGDIKHMFLCSMLTSARKSMLLQMPLPGQLARLFVRAFVEQEGRRNGRARKLVNAIGLTHTRVPSRGTAARV